MRMMIVANTILKAVENGWLWALLALVLWVSAWLIFFSGMIKNFRRERAPHRWGVDLGSRKVTAGKRPLV